MAKKSTMAKKPQTAPIEGNTVRQLDVVENVPAPLSEKEKVMRDSAIYYANAHSYGFGDAKFAMIPVHLLRLDVAYQREISEDHVNELVTNWADNECGHLVVNYRDDGHFEGFNVIDGQHRMQAAIRLGLPAVPCKIYHKLSREQEALMFAEQGNRTKIVNSFAKFRALFCAGDENALLVKNLCDRYKVSTSKKPSGTPGALGGMHTVMMVCDRQGVERVELLFQTIQGCGWHAYPGAYSSAMLCALRNVYNSNEKPKKIMERIINKVGDKSPVMVLCEARSQNTDLGPTRALTKYFSEA